ncbi:MAG: hypothetical protein JKY53_00755 [Flavobacteriales bacterium]|nr:hypothetical protein [Flavobacteriales bacterium]
MAEQNIQKYKIWAGILDKENPRQGIAKSHKQIVKWARDQNLKSVLIAEDDLKFTAKGAFEYYIKNEPEDYDLYLGGIIYGTIKGDNTVNDFSGMHLYKIKQNFYDTFLSIPENRNIDGLLENKGKYVVCNPIIAIQHNGFSDNQHKHQKYDLCIENKKIFKQ